MASDGCAGSSPASSTLNANRFLQAVSIFPFSNMPRPAPRVGEGSGQAGTTRIYSYKKMRSPAAAVRCACLRQSRVIGGTESCQKLLEYFSAILLHVCVIPFGIKAPNLHPNQAQPRVNKYISRTNIYAEEKVSIVFRRMGLPLRGGRRRVPQASPEDHRAGHGVA